MVLISVFQLTLSFHCTIDNASHHDNAKSMHVSNHHLCGISLASGVSFLLSTPKKSITFIPNLYQSTPAYKSNFKEFFIRGPPVS
jgi:hypothetical protein